MRISEITVIKTKKLGLPNYSSVAATCSVKVSLEENDDIRAAAKKAWSEVQFQLDEELTPYGNKNPQAAFAGKDSPEPAWIRGQGGT